MKTLFMKTRMMSMIVVVMFTMGGCSWFDDDLPRDTQDGRGTFGMLLNGQKWESAIIGLQPYATYFPGSNSLLINASKKGKDEIITLVANDIKASGAYKLKFRIAETDRSDSTRLLINGNFAQSYLLLNESESTLNITKFDTVKNVVSGRFSFRFVNRIGDQMSVTDGRFDLKLIIVGQ